MQQLSMFDLMMPPAPPPVVDVVRQAVLNSGLVPNDFILDLNGGITNNRSTSLPSRLFRFPVSVVKDQGGQSHVLLRHPRLRESADVAGFLDEIEEKAGIRPEWRQEFANQHYMTIGAWWHAVDLCTNKHWQDLLATSQFTDHGAILKASQLHVEWGSLSIKNARTILNGFGCVEPEDRSRASLLGDGIWPGRTSGGIAPNIKYQAEAGVWVAIHGIEDGWFKRRGQHLSVTEETMKLRDEARNAA
ncbi:hypothetical protein [Ensifer adhaerens]|uniref:hypothetical protein n=1 Tax=Ensifer adhaerens TaxID=106592 RepID=UPI00098F000A|nr:hypothetical protein [Ensifer adhaerens]